MLCGAALCCVYVVFLYCILRFDKRVEYDLPLDNNKYSSCNHHKNVSFFPFCFVKLKPIAMFRQKIYLQLICLFVVFFCLCDASLCDFLHLFGSYFSRFRMCKRAFRIFVSFLPWIIVWGDFTEISFILLIFRMRIILFVLLPNKKFCYNTIHCTNFSFFCLPFVLNLINLTLAREVFVFWLN